LQKRCPRPTFAIFTGNRRAELDNALEFARLRLAEENTKLKAAEHSLAVLREKVRVYNSEMARKARLDEKDHAEKEVQAISSQIAGAQSRLNVLLVERSHMPKFLETPTITTNAQADALNEKLADLQNERAALLLKYNPTHPAVKQQDELIADVQRRLDRVTKTQVIAVKTRNPSIAEADKVISELKSSIASDETLLVKANARNQAAITDLVHYGNSEPRQENLESSVAKARERIAFLTKDVDDLNIHKQGQHDPVTIVSPAGTAAEVSPRSVKI